MDVKSLATNIMLIVIAYLLSFLIVKSLEPILPAFAFFIIVLYIYDFISVLVGMGMGKVKTPRAAAVIFFIGCIVAIIISVYLTFALLDVLKAVAIILLTILIYRGLHSMFAEEKSWRSERKE